VALSGATAGLLFDEHVERVRALGGCCVGPDTSGTTCRRCNRCRARWHYNRNGGTLSCRRDARPERKFGGDGRALDGLESVARYARCNMAYISTFGCDL